MIYLISVIICTVSFWIGYQTGYLTRKTEEENRARARAARLKEFTGARFGQDGEWYKARKQETTNEHQQKVSN